MQGQYLDNAPYGVECTRGQSLAKSYMQLTPVVQLQSELHNKTWPIITL